MVVRKERTMERAMLKSPLLRPSETDVPTCDRCDHEMSPTGWVPQPDGNGGLRRITAFRCDSCGRLYDPYWGFRVVTGHL